MKPLLLLFSHKSFIWIKSSLLIIFNLILIISSSSNKFYFWHNEERVGIQKKSSPGPYLSAPVFSNQ